MSPRRKTLRAEQLQRLQALANLVAVTLGAAALVRPDEQAAMLRECAAKADGIAGELAEMSGGGA